VKELEIFKKQLSIQNVLNEYKQLEQVDCPVEHLFSEGLYTRIMRVQAGSLVIGKVHRFKTLNIMTKGRALLYTGDDQPTKEVFSPLTFISNPMERKIAFFLEDSEWINVHPTNETDLKKIENHFIIPDDEYLSLLRKEALCLG